MAYQQQEGASQTSIIALVLGILSMLGCGCLTGIPAWIMGQGEIKKIDAGQAPAAGRTMALVGMILGIIATVGGIIFGLIWLFMMGGLALMGGATGR